MAGDASVASRVEEWAGKPRIVEEIHVQPPFTGLQPTQPGKSPKPSFPAPPTVPIHRSHPTSRLGPSVFDFEVLTSAELARLLKVRESWVIDQSKRSRTSDPIPVFRLGKHRRYRWGSPEMNDWLDRRAGYNTTTRKAEPKHKEER